MTSLTRRAFLWLGIALIPGHRLSAAAVTLDEFIELSERLLGRKNLDRKAAQIYLNAINSNADNAVTLAYLVQMNGNPTPEQKVLAATIVRWWNTGAVEWTSFGLSAPFFRGWLVLAIAVLAGDASAQQPGTAGATRPRLEVLQSVPESQLFLLMNLVSDSLGVRCDHCHVQPKPDLTRTPSNVGGFVWDSDDKPAKKIARDMMRMVVDLNAKNFGGRARVTCYTCHHGALDPSRTPPLPPAPGSARTLPAAPLPPIDKVWTNYVAAVGQPGTSPPGTGTIISGWDDRSEGRYGKFEIATAGTTRYRITLTNADGSVTSQGFDGDEVWAATNDRVTRLTGAADMARMRAIAARYRPLKERPAGLQMVRIDQVDGHDVYVARARIDPATVRTLFFDINTGLLRREMTTTDTILIPLQEQVDYADYRDVNGVQMPFIVLTSDGAPYDTTTRTILQIRRDVPVEDALFKPPQ